MAALRICFEELGFENVVTYIQSGNVLFDSEKESLHEFTEQIETALSRKFSYQSKIVLISQEKLLKIIANAPEGFGNNPEEYRYDVIFIKEPLTAPEAFEKIRMKDGVDFVTVGDGVLYFSRRSTDSAQSQMTKMIGTPVYKAMTIRNWNTVVKLAQL